MYSKVKIFGHPIHPMLVAYPIAFYTATFVAYLIYQLGGQQQFWLRAGIAANVAGVVMAVLAALPGLLDWALGIPSQHPAKATGLRHMICNVAALILFIVALIVEAGKWSATQPSAVAPLILSLIGVILTIAAGFYGWTLIQDHHVGIAESTAEAPAAADSEATAKPARGASRA
jgi:uncharacterized membrane protein